MKTCARLWRTSVGKKALSALSGLLFFGYLCVHALGNFTAFSGAAAMDGYAHWLRRMAPLLWTIRVGLAAAVAVHVASTVSLARGAFLARPTSTLPRPARASTFASRTLRVGGPLLLVFLVYHLAHVTFGVVHPSFVSGAVYHNVVTGLSPRWVTVVYVLAAALVGTHLFHALYAAPTSLGVAPPTPPAERRRIAAAVAVVVALGFAAVPVAVALGVVR
jgi:succinate dehydrogenase / fumarate reductase cytochrome b subunit